MKHKCLYCYQELSPTELESKAGQNGFHEKCSKKFFGKPIPPIIDFAEEQLLELAEKVVKSQKTVTGVQPKLSLGITESNDAPDRFTIVGLWGDYILKPQTEFYHNLPENEDLTMHLADFSKIKTVPHSLIRMKSGKLAYITKRIDRHKGRKLPMEDMCQLTERLTEHKYKGSYEQIAKTINKYSSTPGLDITDFYELVLFSFLTGNNDMHLKNFSLFKPKLGFQLCPAYDLVASELVVEDDDEELALNLNGKKKKLKKADFVTAMKASLDDKVIENIFKKYRTLSMEWTKIIDQSFLPTEVKSNYKELIKKKSAQIEL
ncbi:putative DNA-binding transcriptional regulator [Pedobacter glucosidilyticus]|nr:HipA domain-containing protein [Pedobacter glucosidilyticus]KHJ39384.1 putative DNA-binding transcriptional regulator [Pedobacter glucosidilyticus]